VRTANCHIPIVDQDRNRASEATNDAALDLLPSAALMRYHTHMAHPAPIIEDDEDAAEAQALAAAIAESDADPRTAPHEDVRAWLLRLANGESDAPPPEPR
jgi:hypothetical protein